MILQESLKYSEGLHSTNSKAEDTRDSSLDFTNACRDWVVQDPHLNSGTHTAGHLHQWRTLSYPPVLRVCQQRKTPQLTWNNALGWPRTPKGTNTKCPKAFIEVRVCFLSVSAGSRFHYRSSLEVLLSRILFSLGSQHEKQGNCKSTTGVFPWLSEGKAKGLWGILSYAFISHSSSLRELQGLPGVWGVTAPVPWETFKKHTQHIEYTEEGFRKYPFLWTKAEYIDQIKCCVVVDTWTGFILI